MTKDEFIVRYPRWSLEWGYGSWIAVHDNFDASWEGEENGWVGNGLQIYGADYDELAEEIDALVLDKPDYFGAEELQQVRDREQQS